jgi:integrin beta 3
MLVKLDRNVEGREAIKLSKEKTFLEQPVYVTGHPCGLPLKFASGAYVGDVKTSSSFFMADLNVYSSDDGSPVFSAETHELIGIVSRGRARDFRWTGDGWRSFYYPHDDLNFYGTRCTRTSEFWKYLAK